MSRLYLLARNISYIRNNLLDSRHCLKCNYYSTTSRISSSSSSGSDDSSSSDSDLDEGHKSKISVQGRNTEALNKLNALLKEIVEEEVFKSQSTLNFAKPTNKRIKNDSELESHKTESVEKQMVNAVKDVAHEIGGDVKQTESELLLKLLSPADTSIEASATNLSDMVKGMKIDRESKTTEQSRSDQVRSILQVGSRSQSADTTQVEKRVRRPVPKKQSPERVIQKINLFGAEPLGIFTSKDFKESSDNKTWQSLYERDLKLAVTHPPANYFQQMILWTEQGKLWKFPIDNEQGLEEEKKVYFSKHIFLEDHLEPWCPPKGPIRHFMELVCVGLSKNSYLTVEAKKEHIEWYRNYFEDKKKLLQEVGALPAPTQSQNEKSLE